MSISHNDGPDTSGPEGTSTKFETYAIVELMGHARIAGKVSEQTVAGAPLLRVDVPKTSKRDGFTKFYSPGAIYCITPTDEQTALFAAESWNEAPIKPWVLPTSSLLTEGDSNDAEIPWDSDDDYDPPDDDDYPLEF